MSKIESIAGLKNSIQILLEKQELNKSTLNEQLIETYEMFRPVNLIKNVLKKFTASPFIISKLLGPALGLAAGYFLRK
jgi:hypothetical protein